jgi:hypothetical protein
MTCGGFDIDPHHGRFTAQPLWTQTDFVQTFFQQDFHFRRISVRVSGIHRTQNRFFDNRAAVSTEVETPTPTSSGGQALTPYEVITSNTN